MAQHLSQAVDDVRRKENKERRAQGDERLVGTRYDWLHNPTTMDPKDRREFAALRDSELKTARAWALKETAMSLYNYVYEGPARKHFQWWYKWAVRRVTGVLCGVQSCPARQLLHDACHVDDRP